jgi:hypothetical protein
MDSIVSPPGGIGKAISGSRIPARKLKSFEWLSWEF